MLLALTTAGLVLSPRTRLDRFYEESADDGEVKMLGGATARATFAWLLPVSAIPSAILSSERAPKTLIGELIIHRDTAAQWRRSVQLIPIDHLSSTRKDVTSYRGFRVAARSDDL